MGFFKNTQGDPREYLIGMFMRNTFSTIATKDISMQRIRDWAYICMGTRIGGAKQYLAYDLDEVCDMILNNYQKYQKDTTSHINISHIERIVLNIETRYSTEANMFVYEKEITPPYVFRIRQYRLEEEDINKLKTLKNK